MDPLILHNFLQNLYNIMKTLSSSATQLSRNWLFSVLVYSPIRQSEVQKRVAMICKNFQKNNEESEMYRSKSQNKLRSQSENTMYQSNYNYRNRNSKSFIDDSSKYKRAITQNTNTKNIFPSLDYNAHSKVKSSKHLLKFQKMSQKLLLRETCKYLRQAKEFFTKLCQQNQTNHLQASKLNNNNIRDPSFYASITPALTHNQSYDPQSTFTYNNSFFDLNSKTMQQQYYMTENSNKKIFSQAKGIQQTESSIQYVQDSYNDDEVYHELKQNCAQKPSNNLRQLDSQDGIKQFFKRLSQHTKDKILVQDQHKSPPPPPINLDQNNRRLVSSMSVKKKRNSSFNSHYAKKYKMLKKRYAEVIYQRSMDRVHYDANNNCLQNLQQKLKQIQLEKLINQNQTGELKAQVHQMSLALQNSHNLLSFIKLDQIVTKQCLKIKVTYFHGWRLNARSQTLHEQHCLAARNMIGVLKLHNKIIENRCRKNKLVLAFNKMLQGAKNSKLNQQDLLIQGSLLSP